MDVVSLNNAIDRNTKMIEDDLAIRMLHATHRFRYTRREHRHYVFDIMWVIIGQSPTWQTISYGIRNSFDMHFGGNKGFETQGDLREMIQKLRRWKKI